MKERNFVCWLAVLGVGILGVVGLVPMARADTIYATSGEVSEVQLAVDSALEGDVVVIPAGTVVFSGTVSIPVGITVQGEGREVTILESTNTDNYDALFRIQASGVEIRDMQLAGRPQGSGATQDMGVSVGDHQDFVISGCIFRDFGVAAVSVSGADARGVIADSDFIDIYREEIGNLGYGVVVYGDGELNWNRPFALGSPEFVFIEDCYFTGNRHAVASNNGSRYVFRHNLIVDNAFNAQPIDAHGWEYGSEAGSQGYEIYGNTTYDDVEDSWAGITIRGGDGVIYDNDFPHGVNRPIYLRHRMDRPCDSDPAACAAECSGYPLPNQTTDLWVWNNTADGAPATVEVGYFPVTGLQPEECSDLCLFVEGRDYHHQERPGYQPYPYPHPLRSGGLVDDDSDGYPPPEDCDDTDGDVHPNAPERCNGQDDNCDGQIDEGFDLDSDPSHCGGCGNACEPDQACVQGSCETNTSDDPQSGCSCGAAPGKDSSLPIWPILLFVLIALAATVRIKRRGRASL